MRIGLAIIRFDFPGGVSAVGPTLTRIISDAEQAGAASLWFQDHFMQNPLLGRPEDPVPEAYCLLNFAAAITRTVRLGALVTGVTYRHPGVLLKAVTTLDVLSGGRACLGIGAAWYREEHEAFGVPFPSTVERFGRLCETLQLAHRMWSGDDTPFAGRFYRLDRPLNSPPPVQARPPILVGGGGERRTLPLVAQYADACNLFEKFGGDQLRHKLGVLRSCCERIGRPYEDIEKTSYGALALSRLGGAGTQTPAQAIERFGELAALGFDHAIVSLPHPEDPYELELFAEVAEGLRATTTADSRRNLAPIPIPVSLPITVSTVKEHR